MSTVSSHHAQFLLGWFGLGQFYAETGLVVFVSTLVICHCFGDDNVGDSPDKIFEY